jgi:hypothetical protein
MASWMERVGTAMGAALREPDDPNRTDWERRRMEAALRAGDAYDKQHGVVRVRASDIQRVLTILAAGGSHSALYNRLAHAVEPMAWPADLYVEPED